MADNPRLPPGGAPRVGMYLYAGNLCLVMAFVAWRSPANAVAICLFTATLFFAGALWTRLFRREAE